MPPKAEARCLGPINAGHRVIVVVSRRFAGPRCRRIRRDCECSKVRDSGLALIEAERGETHAVRRTYVRRSNVHANRVITGGNQCHSKVDRRRSLRSPGKRGSRNHHCSRNYTDADKPAHAALAAQRRHELTVEERSAAAYPRPHHHHHHQSSACQFPLRHPSAEPAMQPHPSASSS